MGKIFITGDTHGDLDIDKLNHRNFPQQWNLTKKDYLIIAGDYGQVWYDEDQEKSYSKRIRNKLNNRNFTTLFVDGNHENFNRLYSYPVETWCGGKIHRIEDSIIHLMRGQVFIINGVKIFTMGGATSIDKDTRKKNVSWWEQEQPSIEEYEEALKNLDKHNWEVDYVITHTTSPTMMRKLGYNKENTNLNKFFELLEKELSYKHWYFGHFHEDKVFEKHTAIYNKIIKII